MRVGSLFAGIGGFDLAAESLGWSTAWVSEIDPFACAVLAHHFPHAPNLGDITAIDWSRDDIERPDILCGGFPCQPHSLAGKRGASADERDLWGECVRAVRALRPRYAVFENVEGLLSSESGRFFGRVLGDLAAVGYDAEWDVLSACSVGAPFTRSRVFILAHPHRKQLGRDRQPGHRSPSHSGRHPDRARSTMAGQREQWTKEPGVDRVANGVPAQVDRNKSLGNAIVPQCAVEGPFRRIIELEGLAPTTEGTKDA